MVIPLRAGGESPDTVSGEGQEAPEALSATDALYVDGENSTQVSPGCEHASAVLRSGSIQVSVHGLVMYIVASMTADLCLASSRNGLTKGVKRLVSAA